MVPLDTVLWMGGLAAAVIGALGMLVVKLVWARVAGVTKAECDSCHDALLAAFETGDGTFGLLRDALAVIVQAQLAICASQGAECGDLVDDLRLVYRRLVTQDRRRP